MAQFFRQWRQFLFVGIGSATNVAVVLHAVVEERALGTRPVEART